MTQPVATRIVLSVSRTIILVLLLLCVAALPVFANDVPEPNSSPTQRSTALISAELPWWVWALLLFGFTIALGVVAVIGGVGGGVLFVPIVSAVFPFHFDFVRGAGLMVALCGALSAGPKLLRGGIASMRLGLPMALLGSIGSIAGAFLGLALPTGVVEGFLGLAILSIVVLMLFSSRSEFPDVNRPDPLGRFLGIQGSYHDESVDRDINWSVHRTPTALFAYVGIGLIGGLFGLGAGWANVPALNLLLGAPLRVAVATSGFVMTLNSTAATWVYVNSAAVLPLVTVPSVAGMIIGARIGARLLPRVQARIIRWIVIGLMALAGLRSLVAGIMGVIS